MSTREDDRPGTKKFGKTLSLVQRIREDYTEELIIAGLEGTGCEIEELQQKHSQIDIPYADGTGSDLIQRVRELPWARIEQQKKRVSISMGVTYGEIKLTESGESLPLPKMFISAKYFGREELGMADAQRIFSWTPVVYLAYDGRPTKESKQVLNAEELKGLHADYYSINPTAPEKFRHMEFAIPLIGVDNRLIPEVTIARHIREVISQGVLRFGENNPYL